MEDPPQHREIEHVKDIASHIFKDNVYCFQRNRSTYILASRRAGLKGNYTAFVEIGKSKAKPEYRSRRSTNGTWDDQKLHSIIRAVRDGNKVLHFSTTEDFNKWSKGGLSIINMIDSRFYVG